MIKTDPLTLKVQLWLESIKPDKPIAKIPPNVDRDKFIAIVNDTYGYDVNLNNNTVVKRPAEKEYADLFDWHNDNPGYYELKANGKHQELWKGNQIAAVR